MDGSREAGYMDRDLFMRIVDDAAATGVTEARLFLGGEPLLHREIARFVRYAADAGLLTNIHTNATLLDAGMSESLMDAGLHMLTFSFDGETAEEYEGIRIGADFERVLDNILLFLRMKRDRGASLPETTLQLIRPVPPSGSPRTGVGEGFRSRFEGLPLDKWLVIPPHNWAGEMSGIGEAHPGKVYFPCQLPWRSLSIAWDGRVVACCGDLNGRMILGDLRESTISEVWNGERLLSVRRQLLGREKPVNALCSACTSPWRAHHPVVQDLIDFMSRGRTPRD
jgi:MoaA/NifB/PqqE/SkfB family radical SAM enzyme